MKKSQNRKIKIYIVFTILIFLSLIAFGGYYFITTKPKPKEIFTSTIDKTFEKITMQNDVNSVVGNVSLKTNLHSDNKTIEKMLDIVNNLDVNFKYGIDFNNDNIHTALDANYNQDELVDISTCIESNGLYINLKDIYDKTMLIPIKKYINSVVALFNQNDIKIISKSLNDAINDSLKDKYFVKKNTKVILNGEEVSVIKNTLTLNNSNLNKIIDDMKEKLSNNDEFLNSLSQILNITNEEAKNKIESINNNNSIQEIITISLYTKENNVVGFEIARTSNAGLSLLVLKDNETNYSYEIKNSVDSYKGNVEVNKNNDNINLKISSNSDKISGTINIDITYEKNKDIDDFVKNDIVEIEKVTEQERTEMFDILQKKESIKLLIKSLWNLIEI